MGLVTYRSSQRVVTKQNSLSQPRGRQITTQPFTCKSFGDQIMSFRGRGGGRGGGGRGGRGGFRGGGRGGGRGGFQQRDFGPPDYVTGNGRPYS